MVSRLTFAIVSLMLLPNLVEAGIYNSAEPPLTVESDLVKFQEKLANLRSLAPPDPRTMIGVTGRTERDDYLEKIEALRHKAKGSGLSADETANLGAYLYRVRKTNPRVPDLQEAVQVLEEGRRKYPRHFGILANLGTAYQASGVTDAAESCLEEAVALAPPEWERYERYQLLLLKRRSREPKTLGTPPLDPLFFKNPREPLRFVGPSGKYEIGALAPEEQAKLPGGSVEEATRIVQQLLLWLPEDGRLLWQLGEFAAVLDQPKAAARAFVACVDSFRLSTLELKQHRAWLIEYEAWTSVLSRLGTRQHQFLWIAQWLPAGTVTATGWAGPSNMVSEMKLAEAVQAKMVNPFAAPGGGGTSGPIFTWDLISWPMVAGGGAVVLLLLALQVREWSRRRNRVSTVAKGTR